ncbi:Magnesium and cobalt transport protein CorA [Thermogutta terrifontis]|uniref:Magnesium transport protein CorA n=1 Tax=Thermogutta terrifontis TaxID=1331910 RepID=A0A286RJK0_9BACT|nr:magnesium/cobalt transporter CorA [Thermogutta terrifontis]ASV76141.1 Magnesium and cobalt transport protein CorA [Thermogutta terrifontis]
MIQGYHSPEPRKSRRSTRYRIRRRTPPGAAPGTIIPEPTSQPPRITLTHVLPESLEEQEIQQPAMIRSWLSRPGWIWCDIDGPGDSQFISEVAQVFNLHPLALEDVVNTHQRAKVEEYNGTLFITMRLPHIAENGIIESEQISIFLGPNFLVSFQPRPGDAFTCIRKRFHNPESPLRQLGPSYLAYSLIDLIIDHYFPVLDFLGEKLESLEEKVTSADARKVLREIHDLRRELLYLRRILWPHRDAVQSLLRDYLTLLPKIVRVHLRDCWDHVVLLLDLTETYRELCADLRDYCLSAISNRMNEVMKWLTLIATIFIPLSFIAGVYGMNFDPDASPWNMPELRWYYGYPFSLLLMLAVATLMIWVFYRRGWIGQDWPISDSVLHRSPATRVENQASRRDMPSPG